MVTALVAKSFLARNSDETILYNIICSNAVKELVEKLGGRALVTEVGHALIKPKMKEHNAIFGGEHSGHFYFRDNWFADSGMIAFLVCLELLSIEDRDLHEMIGDIDPYFRSGEINSKVELIEQKIKEISEKYSDCKQDRLDGLTIRFPEYWFNLRASNTEPLLRLNVEANSQEILDKKVEELLNIINNKKLTNE